MIEFDIVIIGAGPAGVTAGTYLLKQGLDVLVIEKAKFPRFVIGESLLPRCMDIFEEVGLLPYLEKQNYQLKKGVIFRRNGEESIFDFSEQFTQGKPYTWHVPRAHFDNVLAESAQDMGLMIEFETALEDIALHDNHQILTLSNKDGEQKIIRSKFVIDSSGYGRVLPRLLDLNDDSQLPVRTTIFSHFQDARRQDFIEESNYILYLVHDKYYVWNIPFADGRTSIGFVGENEVFDEIKGDIANKYDELVKGEPYLLDRYGSQEILFSPRMLKGFSVGVKQLYGEGYALTGNATEFLDPIFSSGVTVAAESGLLAAKLASKQLAGEQVDWAEEYEKPIRFGIEVFKTYVSAWYDKSLQTIFFSKNQSAEMRRQICSILAGYVWDETNPCVNRYQTILDTLCKVIEIQGNTNVDQ
jgi:flavin-dependent dehydrogenase